VLEEQVGGQTTAQYVWSPVYVDALVLRDRYAGGVRTDCLYVQLDANWNVTSLVSTGGVVVERYVYDPFGKVIVRDPVTW
jgi:YD repeat-containing protein